MPSTLGIVSSATRLPYADIIVGHVGAPYVTAYKWNAGFGTKYSDPANFPSGVGSAITTKYSNSGRDVLISTELSPYIVVYPWSSAGFGTKYANPATLPAGVPSKAIFNPTDSSIVVSHATSPYLTAYPWDSGFGTKYADQSPTISGTGRGLAFKPSGDALYVGGNGASMVIYPFTSSGIGSTAQFSYGVAASAIKDIAHSSTANRILITLVTDSVLRLLSNSYSNTPATSTSSLTSNGNSVAWNTGDDRVAVTMDATPYVAVYNATSNLGTIFANPATLPTGAGQGVAFGLNLDNTAVLAVAHTASPYVTAYPLTASAFGTKYANPASLPAGDGTDVDFISYFV